MSDNSILRSIEDQVQRLIALCKENPGLIQGSVSQVFEQWEEEHVDAPTLIPQGGLLQWCGSKLSPAHAFVICLTEADKEFLREMGIKP